MQNVILISVNDLTELAALELNSNMLCAVIEDGSIYRGDPENTTPIKLFDNNNKQPIQGNIRNATTTDTLLEDDFIVECDGTFTITLFSADGMVTGRIYHIINVGSGTVTVEGDGSEQISGNTNIALAQWDSLTLCVNSAGTGWNSL